jgi:hypothetical protein
MNISNSNLLKSIIRFRSWVEYASMQGYRFSAFVALPYLLR